MIKLSLITSEQPNVIAKNIHRQADGSLKKTSTAYMNKGTVTVIDLLDLYQFNGLLDSLAPCNALAFGAPSQPHSVIVKAADLPATPGAISRSDKYFAWPQGEGVLFLDYDPDAGDETMQPQALTDALRETLGDCGMLWRPSASGFIYDSQSGGEIDGLKGQHVYVTVADATDIPRAGAVLFKRLWLKGLGRIITAQNGAQLVRSLVDGAVWQPSRLDFAAGAVCGPGIHRAPPAGVVLDGPVLDTRTALPDLTNEEEHAYLQAVNEAKKQGAPASANVREQYIAQRAQAEGVSVEAVRARYEMAEDMQVLCGDFPIEMANGDIYSVKHIMANPDTFNGQICLDPIEPEYNNRHPVGKLYLDAKGTSLDSKAHGGRVFYLGIDTGEAFKAKANDGQTFAEAMRDIRATGGELDNVEALATLVNTGPFSPNQRALLTSELEGQLKENKRLTPQVKAMLQGAEGPAQYTGATVSNIPRHAQGAALPQSMPLHPDNWVAFQTSGKDEKPLGTLDNFKVIANAYGVHVSFNVISKETTLDIPGHGHRGALHDESAINHMVSLSNLNKYPKGDVPGYVCCLAAENAFNPVQEMILRAPWDGGDHIGLLFSQMTLDAEEDATLCEMFFRKWMRAAIACGTGVTEGCESVLVLVDEMGGSGKTRFFRTLCDETLRADGVTLDMADKDSIKEAISHWLVELGELDGTFNKSEMAHLKAFLSKRRDDIRLPYARTYSKFPRNTAFMASVNQTNFLTDDTGNRRFWPIRVMHINHDHNVNVQQAWAQASAEVQAGQAWHLNEEENRICAERNQEFKAVSRVEDALTHRIDVTLPTSVHMTCTEIATLCGLTNAHKGELNEVARWLRSKGFQYVARQGKRGFVVPPMTLIAVVPDNVTHAAFNKEQTK